MLFWPKIAKIGSIKDIPSLKFNANLYGVFTVLKIYTLQINAVIIEDYVALYV